MAKDQVEAFKLYHKAADQGFVLAQLMLGVPGAGGMAQGIFGPVLALALSSPKPLEQNPRSETERRLTWLLQKKGPIVASVAVAWLLIAAQTIPLLAQTEIGESQAAVARGDSVTAKSAAMKARRIQPWATSPALQLALVMEQEGNLVQASAWIREAIKHDKTNWSLWLISTRIDVKRGEVGKAKQSLRRTIELNPRSPRMIGDHPHDPGQCFRRTHL